jgi:hypothetical protein
MQMFFLSILTYENEFAIDEDNLISKPWFSGDLDTVLSRRTAQTAVVDLFRPSIRVCVSPDYPGDAAYPDHLVSGKRFDPPPYEAGPAVGRFHAGLRLVPPH